MQSSMQDTKAVIIYLSSTDLGFEPSIMLKNTAPLPVSEGTNK